MKYFSLLLLYAFTLLGCTDKNEFVLSFARLFHVRMSQHVGIDCTFVELLPDWYSNKMTEVTLIVHANTVTD